MQKTLSAAIRCVTGDAMFLDAYPAADTASFSRYHRSVLVECAEALGFSKLADRFQHDDELLKLAATVVLNFFQLLNSLTDSEIFSSMPALR